MNNNIIKESTSRTPLGTAWFRARIPEQMLIDINILNAKRRPETFSDTIKVLLEKALTTNGSDSSLLNSTREEIAKNG